MQICNACRYCEGFCAVFPAMTRRLEFAKADVNYLANLCHNCGACYTPANTRRRTSSGSTCRRRWPRCASETYAEYAWPPALGALYKRNGLTVGARAGRRSGTVSDTRPRAARLAAAAAAGRQLLRGLPAQPDGGHVRRWSSVFRCWRWAWASGASGATSRRLRASGPAVAEATRNVLALTYLDGGHGDGCNESDDRSRCAPAVPPLHVLRLHAVLRRDLVSRRSTTTCWT